MYTYAFFQTSEKKLRLNQGIAGELQIVSTPKLSALVESDLDLEMIQNDDTQLVQAVLTHDRTICDLFWQTTILPLRFGTWFVSEERLMAHLEANEETYLAKLRQLEGKAEYRLMLTPIEPADTPSIDPVLKGKDYFLAKKQRFQSQLDQQSQQQQEFQQMLSAIAEAYPSHILMEAKSGIEKLYLLVDRQQEGMLYDHLQNWQTHCPHWELGLGEALPPYHFV